MKNVIVTSLLLMMTVAVRAQEGLVDQTPVDRNLRIGAVHDTHATPSRGSATGIEIGYAQQIMPLDQMALTFRHLSKGPVEQNSVLLSFEDHYKLTATLKLYGTSGVGYMETHLDDDSDRSGLIGKLGVGLMLDMCSRSALYAEVAYLIGSKDLWVDGNSQDSENVTVSAGIRWFY